jgi:hypothetical protein
MCDACSNDRITVVSDQWSVIRKGQRDKGQKDRGTRDKKAGVGWEKGLFAPAMLACIDGGSGVAVGFAALLGFALVPVLLALGQGKLAFHSAVTEVKPGGNERMTLDLRLGE